MKKFSSYSRRRQVVPLTLEASANYEDLMSQVGCVANAPLPIPKVGFMGWVDINPHRVCLLSALSSLRKVKSGTILNSRRNGGSVRPGFQAVCDEVSTPFSDHTFGYGVARNPRAFRSRRMSITDSSHRRRSCHNSSVEVNKSG